MTIHTHIRSTLLALLLILPAATHAQVNIEHYRGKPGVSGAASASLSGDIGNVDNLESDGAGFVSYSRTAGTYLAVLRGAAGFLGGERYANSGVLHLRYTMRRHDHVHPEVFVQGDYARSRLLDARSLIGAGARWNLLRSERVSFSIGTSLMFERERLDLEPGDVHADRTSDVRMSSYINLHTQSERGVSLATTAYYQPSLEQLDDARVLGTVELTTPIIGPLTQTTTVDFRIDTDPPEGVKDTDVKLSASFGVQFGRD